MREERDALGSIEVPDERYYGATTARSLKSFTIGWHLMPRPLIDALLLIKEVAAVTNRDLGLLSSEKCDLILQAIEKIRGEKMEAEFPLSLFQTGSGTQTNMNVNEVIANVANEIAGSPRGTKSPIHPNDDVNLSQSSNDVFPTAMHIAIVKEWVEKLQPSLTAFRDELKKKEQSFEGIIKIGRTHLMDAVPITLAQEFSGYVAQANQNLYRLETALPHLFELPLGGTAVGTGLNAHPQFGAKSIEKIRMKTGLPFIETPNRFQGLASKDPFVFASGALKTLACSLIKVANDIRWMGSGPRAGFYELLLPANEPGSSIMPGKVNPTQSEAMTMVSVHVIGNDTGLTLAGSQGNFELNVYMPVIFYNLYESVALLSDAMDSFREHLLVGLKANHKMLKKHLENSLMLVTALVPKIGYDQAAKVAKLAHEQEKSLKEVVLELKLMDEATFNDLMQPQKMI